MRWVPDTTGRFRRRPHYEPREIDRECERLTIEFLTRRFGRVEYPLKTDRLLVMIEEHVGTLDVYADLTGEGYDVEGVTRFRAGVKPDVEIADPLSTDDRRENRYRTTLSHELGHVRLHDSLFQRTFAPGDLFDGKHEDRVVCKRETILDAPKADWMEWQASYASGAFLMPRDTLNEHLRPMLAQVADIPPFQLGSGTADRLVAAVISLFQVSRDAAVVRLIKLDYLTRTPRAPTLFG